MSLQVKVGTFAQRAGTGTQPITGVGFEPTGVFVWGNMYGGNLTRTGAFNVSVGMSDGTNNLAYCMNAGNFLNAIEASEFGFAQNRCFMRTSIAAGGGFTGVIITDGIISSFDPDGFTANFLYDQNDLCAGSTWNYLALGGVDVQVGFAGLPGVTGTVTVSGLPFAPTAVLGWRAINQVGPSNGAEGQLSLGVVAACGLEQFSFSGANDDSTVLSTDASYQPHDIWSSTITSVATVAGETTLTAFTSDGFTVDFTGGSLLAQYYMAIGGCSVNVGTFTQSATTGTQSVPITASRPRGMLVFGINKPTTAAPVPDFLLTIGGTDGTTQASAWSGTLSGQPANYKVDQNVSVTDAIIAYTPTGDFASTVNTVGAISALNNGSFDVTWTTVDGVAREWVYCVFADDFGTGPCGTGHDSATYQIRRERIFLLPSDLDLRMFLKRLEFLVQAGVGLTTGQGSNPTFTVEISRDGGQTYGTVYVLSPGALGDYAHRSFVHRLGQYRQATVRVAMSDPVLWALLESWADLEKGLN